MKKGEKTFDLILVVIAVIFVILASQITPFSKMTASSEGFYPLVISIISLILAAANYLKSMAARKQNGANAVVDETSVFNKDVLVMMGLLILYIVLIFLVHYIIATLVFTTLAVLYLSAKEWKTSLMVGFIATMMIVLVFKYGFSVILP